MKTRFDKDWIVLGQFGRPHGVHGYIKVNAFTAPEENLLSYTNWYIRDIADQQPKVIKRLGQKSLSQGFSVLIEGYQTRERASLLTNLFIAVPKADIPKLEAGEYYWHELLGMTVCTVEPKRLLGTVESMMETGSNDVLVVKDGQNKKKHLIPFIQDDVIHHIDTQNRIITVDWDEDF